jgi:hypothetical protein
VKVVTDAGDVAIELVDEGANRRDGSFTETADELLAHLREGLLGGHPVGNEYVLKHVGYEGASRSGLSFDVLVRRRHRPELVYRRDESAVIALLFGSGKTRHRRCQRA